MSNLLAMSSTPAFDNKEEKEFNYKSGLMGLQSHNDHTDAVDDLVYSFRNEGQAGLISKVQLIYPTIRYDRETDLTKDGHGGLIDSGEAVFTTDGNGRVLIDFGDTDKPSFSNINKDLNIDLKNSQENDKSNKSKLFYLLTNLAFSVWAYLDRVPYDNYQERDLNASLANMIKSLGINSDSEDYLDIDGVGINKDTVLNLMLEIILLTLDRYKRDGEYESLDIIINSAISAMNFAAAQIGGVSDEFSRGAKELIVGLGYSGDFLTTINTLIEAKELRTEITKLKNQVSELLINNQ